MELILPDGNQDIIVERMEKLMAPILHFIDGGDSHRCALIDNELATLTVNNGWKVLLFIVLFKIL